MHLSSQHGASQPSRQSATSWVYQTGQHWVRAQGSVCAPDVCLADQAGLAHQCTPGEPEAGTGRGCPADPVGAATPVRAAFRANGGASLLALLRSSLLMCCGKIICCMYFLVKSAECFHMLSTSLLPFRGYLNEESKRRLGLLQAKAAGDQPGDDRALTDFKVIIALYFHRACLADAA